jgi:hypothetical protein
MLDIGPMGVRRSARAAPLFAMAVAVGCGGATELSTSERDVRTGDDGSGNPTDPFDGTAGDDGVASDAGPSVQPTQVPSPGTVPDASPGDEHEPIALDANATDSADVPGQDSGPEAGALPSTAPCLTGGHVLKVEGDPGCFWFSGTQYDALGSSWAVEAEAYFATYDGASIQVLPPASAQSGGPGWFLNFNTWNAREPMQTGVVYDVGMVSNGGSFGYASTCVSASGSFRVDDFRATGGTGSPEIGMLLSFTAAFSIACDGSPGVLRGCIHF